MSGTSPNDARKKMLERVRALLAKTTVNGCTQGEMMAALGKARELMATYELSESDLQPETERAYIGATGDGDPYQIKWHLMYGVGRFTRCVSWRSRRDGNINIKFCGLDSDVAFATWLLDMLQAYVMRELKNFRAARLRDEGRCPRIMSSSFVHGATERIEARLIELTPEEPTGKGRVVSQGLVVSRNALIDAALAAAGVKIRQVRSSTRYVNGAAFSAGVSAGDAASFGRPVEAGGALRLGRAAS